jgi:hypothetical protein
MSPPSSGLKTVPPKRQSTFNGLHDIIAKKTEIFISTAVRAADPATI